MALIDKASLLMVPSTYEAGTLYNVLPSGNRAPDSTDENSGYDQTRADFTFDRGSNAAATRVNADGLIEKYRENLLLQSNQFDTTWGSVGITKTSGQSGYDGSTDAWLLTDTASSGDHRLYIANSHSGVHTLSVYAKTGTKSIVYIQSYINNSSAAYFDLSDGSVLSTTFDIESKIESVGNGWYRCSMTFTNTNSYITIGVAESTTRSYAGDGTGTIYIQNAQLESGMVSTEYLESTSVTAKAGVLIDLPRINYDANGENGALLLEPQRSNLIPHSEYIEDGAWTKSNATITTNHATSPEGVQNASLVTFASGGYILDSVTTTKTIGSKETISVFSNADISGTFLKYGGGTAAGTDVEGREVIGNGWYRYYVTRTFTEAETASTQLLIAQSNVGNSVLIYGAQLEAGYLTSYIPNYGTSGGVTRAADNHDLSDITSLIGTTQGSWFMDWEIADSTSRDNSAVGFELSSADNRDELNFSVSADGDMRMFVRADNLYSQKYVTSNKSGKWCLVWNGTSLKLFQDGVEVYNDASALVYNDYTTYEGDANLQYKVKQVILFPTALSDAECITLTTL